MIKFAEESGEGRTMRGVTRRDFLKYVGVAGSMALGLQFLGCAQQETKPVETETVETAEKKEIVIGALFDLTGPTGDVGKDYAQGVQDYVRLVNERGGINGYMIKLEYVDYAYKVPEALSAYRNFKSMGVPGIIGWGTGDTDALRQDVARDKIVFISASYSPKLTNPAEAPYNFVTITDYTTQLRAVLKFAKENSDKEKPKVVFIYPNVPYGTDPIPGGKEYAEELGFEIGPDEIVDLKATSAMEQLQRVKEFGADFAWVGGTISSTSVILKNAMDLGLETTFMVNVWGWDKRIIELAGEAAEGHYYNWPGVLWGDESAKGMADILYAHNTWHPDDGGHTIHYIKGWLNAMMMLKGIQMVVDKGEEVTGENIKHELETLRDYDPEGLAPPISWFPYDHRPSMVNKIYTVREGKIELLGIEELERRADWLGK
ncbi:MAG: ABC transporter substrate-binding protein [Archaeoglobales archaeon]|nr:MAG: ABC transporter substrate-binding protein [Archaeoglobales archaeon]